MSDDVKLGENEYAGPATLVVDGTEVAAEVVLRGHFQPIDGYFHWYGRIADNPELSALAGNKKARVTIDTGEGTATGEISDPDPWNRYRITGVSTPPFTVPTSIEDLG
ncbi:MAG: DUF4873 domain-containing protein [Haloechinothrix sp.]